MTVGPAQLLIIVLLIVVLFGAKKLPDAARSIGRSMRIFKSEVSEMSNDGKNSSDGERDGQGEAAREVDAPRGEDRNS
ncbi:Sec-independent protein translocase subunit TatA [Corynebacterium otitidis]|uniref:Sec-independent protein translocase protein TatA n=1 Tax=Corynebacterium otitidis ATCC 51513 TaxID=883169 RepID=K0Z4S5_9CORY|nr:Sec-independent protein translocase subunit TatA [Corynebacterium otitidis]EJZ82420.1 TatA/E family twin arginine-targeting protein translocase [Corynebacterium otitidis ATCC 51513]KKO84596.1 preprotein translocase subunit TatA [Corynebacterium otitidis]